MDGNLSLGKVVPAHYTLDLEIDPTKPNFKGKAVIELRVADITEFPKEFKVNGVDLVVLSAELVSGDASDAFKGFNVKYNKENQEIVLSHDESSLPVRDDSKLEITYLGKVSEAKTHREKTIGLFKTNYMGGYFDSSKSDNIIISTHCQPIFARHIFPCVDELASKCSYQLSIKTLKRFTTVSNTAVASTEDSEQNGTEWVTTRFDRTPKMATSLFGFAIGDFKKITTFTEIGGNNVDLAVYAPWRVEEATFSLDIMKKYLPIVSEYFGFDYPLKKLDIVLLPFLSDMAMENFGMISIQVNHLLLSPSMLGNEGIRKQVHQLVVHELVHQWIGNYVSFDSWSHLWFNESFATWCSSVLLEDNGDLPNYWNSDDYLNEQVENAMVADSHLGSKSIYELNTSKSQDPKNIYTHEIFDPHSYNKGIVILRSMQLTIGSKTLKDAFQAIFKQIKDDSVAFHEKPIKPIDLFSKFGELLKSENITKFYTSWTRTSGLPIVSVESMGGGKSKLTQHRYVPQHEDELDFEDVPYYIPLFMLESSGNNDEKNILLTDRSLSLDSEVLAVNSNSQGYYRVSYESDRQYEIIINNMKEGKLPDAALSKVFVDMTHFIGDSKYQKEVHISGVLKIINAIATESEIDITKYWSSLSNALEILRRVHTSLGVAQRAKLANKFIDPLLKKIEWPSDFTGMDYSDSEIKVRDDIFFLMQDTKDENHNVFKLADRYYKNVLTGPAQCVPLGMVGSVFTLTSKHFKTVKQWKKLFELVKSARGISNHVIMNDKNVASGTDASVIIQNLAIENLAYSRNEEIISKVLNFITTNIDSEGINRAMFGLLSTSNRSATNESGKETGTAIRDLVWKWFELHYDQWARKSMREGAQSAEKLRIQLNSITLYVFEMFGDSQGKIDKFVAAKLKQLGDNIDLESVWGMVKTQTRDNKVISKDVKKQL
ncbi:Tma108p RNJ42_00326 [Nakaseomyces bracarensis]|uniref:Tma108p n=1 Tax=Nakaseomyces bracarensis TaxID=273131 RepID=UPI0038712348